MIHLQKEHKSDLKWSDLRGKFPALSRCVYLDTAQLGPVSSDAAEAARQYYEAWSNEYGVLAAHQWNRALQECRQAVARFLGASEPEIGFVPNTSTAMTCAALLFEGQGAVLTARGEHPAVITPWFARKYRIDIAEPESNGALTVQCYERALRSDTRVIAVSHVRYNDGKVNDLAGLARLARAHNLHLVVDLIQSIGILPIDVQVGVDVAGFAGFKWLNAGHGSGAIFVRDHLLQRYGLPVAGNRSRRTTDLIEISTFDPLLEARAFELGTMCVPNLLALRASLELINRIGPDRILARVGYLTTLLRKGLGQIGVRTPTDSTQDEITPIVSAIVPNVDQTAKELIEQGVQVSARGGGLRIAVSWYNNEADIERCLAALIRCK